MEDNYSLSTHIEKHYKRTKGVTQVRFIFNGERINLNTITKADADRIVEAGFPFLEKITAPSSAKGAK